ncbi:MULTISPECIES: hypothetical protein [unclassified Bradyrhizobium]|uniref:hypothetical protein n=1 Tax=unclassified Bradyrhizobium TaxID=2631580 RepID=UPI0012EBB254|nr:MULTISPECIES: hypothetical protein [unclassified Bradyrhizobium]MCP3465679.1 hypothetical protein [Bradyrhizobium sp. CCGUVB23]
MIYTPNPALDTKVLANSRELVREALALLRGSDHLVSALRLREELGRQELPRSERQRPGVTSVPLTAS